MQATPIGWTDYSTNLLKYRNAKGVVVWACVHASEGCRNCYSEALANRWGRGEAFTAENMKVLTPFFDTSEANQVLKSKKIAGKKVFVDDMSDLFGEWVSDEIIDQHFAIFALRPYVTFQVLTKRATRMKAYLESPERKLLVLDALCRMAVEQRDTDFMASMRSWLNQETLLWGYFTERWPLRNVHIGVSVEDQKNANERVPLLMKTPAAVKFVSVEPMIGAVDLEMLTDGPDDGGGWIYRHWNALDGRNWCDCQDSIHPVGADPINGVIIGGESGAGHREMPLTEALMLAGSARAAGISVYFKQDSGPRPGMKGRIPDDVWAMKEWPTAA